MSAPGSRSRRVNERVRQLVAETLEREVSDPRVSFVTVTDVRATSDLKTATIFVTVLDRKRREDAIAGLNSARGLLQRRIGARLGTRNTPLLEFVFDAHQERAVALTRLIDGLEVRADEPSVDADPPSEGA